MQNETINRLHSHSVTLVKNSKGKIKTKMQGIKWPGKIMTRKS